MMLAVEEEIVWLGLRHKNAICEGEMETNREESNQGRKFIERSNETTTYVLDVVVSLLRSINLRPWK